MVKTASGHVGQKGELFPPKEVREEAGLKPGDQVLYKAAMDISRLSRYQASARHSQGEKRLKLRSKNSKV